MSAEFMTIEEFNERLQAWNGKEIKVSKVELNDFDEVNLKLNRTTYDSASYRLDDYEPKYEMELKGEGVIDTEAAGSQPLPDNTYEIPLDDDTIFERDGGQLMITTSRGVYKIELAQKN